MIRDIGQWKLLLKGLDAQKVAKRIMGDLTHYYHDRTYQKDDEVQLANALVAFAELWRDNNETP